MKLTWKYVKKLKDINIFNTIKEKYNMEVPKELQNYIIEFNGGMPEPYCFDTNNRKGCVFHSLFSYNKEDNFNIFFILTDFNYKNLLPFASDASGNILCIDLLNKTIKYIDHETEEIEIIKNSLDEFLNSIYQ